MAHNNSLCTLGYLISSKQSCSMAFYGLLLCGFHINCTQYVWKHAAPNVADELNRVQHHPACLPLTRIDGLQVLGCSRVTRKGADGPPLKITNASAKLLLPGPHGVRR